MIRIKAQRHPSNLTAAINVGIGAILLLVAGAAFACTGRVVGVTDGDTIKVLCDRTEVIVRLTEIDAPERGKPFGAKAKVALSDLVFGRQVRLEVADTDRYGRSIARVWIGGTDANRAMIRRGYLSSYPTCIIEFMKISDTVDIVQAQVRMASQVDTKTKRARMNDMFAGHAVAEADD